MKTHYLTICPMESISKTDDTFTGYLYPKNYQHWKECTPLTLLFEGIHQFCVRLSYVASSTEQTPSTSSPHLKMPAKIKQLKLGCQPDFEVARIIGQLTAIHHAHLVTFTVSSLSQGIMIAQGDVYVASHSH